MTDIKSVDFGFEGPSSVRITVNRTATHKPEEISDWLKRHYTYAAEGGQSEAGANLYVTMESEKEDILYFRLIEYRDPAAPDFDWNIPDRELGVFEINLTRALEKDWPAYLTMRKMKGGLRLESGLRADEARTEMHKFISDKVENLLAEKGLKDKWNAKDRDVGRMLVSLFSEYRGWMNNREDAAKFAMGEGPRRYF